MPRKQRQQERRRETITIASAGYPSAPPATASNYLEHLDRIRGDYQPLRPVLYLRVSHENQVADGTLQNHEDWLFKKLFEEGIRPHSIYVCQESGADTSRRGRVVLVTAARRASRIGQPLVAIGASRFLRHSNWSVTNRDVRPTEESFQELLELTGDAELATWLEPDAEYEIEHQTYSLIRAELSGNFGGRPLRPKGRRELLRPEALRLRANGMSWREIAKTLNCSHSTVQSWLSGS